MSQEKKLVLFFAAVFLWMLVATQLSRRMGWLPPPKKPVLAPIAVNDDKPKPGAGVPADAAAGKADAQPQGAQAKGPVKPEAEVAVKAQGPAAKTPKEPEIELVPSSELILGSVAERGPGSYRIRVQLEQNGAGVDSVDSALYNAEFEFGKPPQTPPRVHQPRSHDTSLPGAHPGPGREAQQNPR